MLKYPDNFTWGSATASYQVEGAWRDGGKGESIWDRFTHTPGNIERGDTGDIACDQYHRYKEDVQLMKSLGLHAYRFSISWPRIFPTGKKDINQQGLDHYDRLVDELLKAGIEPWVTLHHWDLPQALQEEDGGWPFRGMSDYFAEYAKTVAEKLSDRVTRWMTFNEPWVIAFMGYRDGTFAPGIKDQKQAYQAAYHLMLAHGKAYSAIKSIDKNNIVGFTHNYQNLFNITRDEASEEFIRFKWEENNGIFLNPVLKGTYPQIILDKIGSDAPLINKNDLKIMNQCDFIGIQYYFDIMVMHGTDESILEIKNRPLFFDYTEMGWPVTPGGFYESIMTLKNKYNVHEIIVTENGSAWHDVLSHDGKVYDDKRQDYLRKHLFQVHRAINDGAPVTGYFAWSLMDNFEWAFGYRPRFGLIYVDYPTQQRFIKESGFLFKKIIQENGLSL